MSPKTIVIADDEPHLVHILAYNLKKAGFVVETAGNGAACVELAGRLLPDMVITDYQMPVLDGLAACVRMKQDARTANIPVLMLTARGHRISAVELAQTNIRDLQAKPFSARQVLAKVEEILAAAATKAAA